MSPRIARAAEPVAAASPMRSAALRAEIQRVMERAKSLDTQSIDLSRRFAGAQQRVGQLVADGASAEELAAARELVERLRRETDELIAARAALSARHKALRAELVPIEAEELLAVAVSLAARLDGVVRPAGREVRSILPQFLKAAAAQSVAERRLSAQTDQRKEHLTALVEAVPALDALVKVAEAMADYATTTRAPAIARSGPVDDASTVAPSTTSPAPNEAVEAI